MKNQVKQTLVDILDAFCLTTENRSKVMKLANIPSESIFDGVNDYYQQREKILSLINEDTAKSIINQMPFPFIKDYYKDETKAQKAFTPYFDILHRSNGFGQSSMYWINNVLCELPKKKGYQIRSEITQYAIIIK
jgi:hypothetical protein